MWFANNAGDTHTYRWRCEPISHHAYEFTFDFERDPTVPLIRLFSFSTRLKAWYYREFRLCYNYCTIFQIYKKISNISKIYFTKFITRNTRKLNECTRDFFAEAKMWRDTSSLCREIRGIVQRSRTRIWSHRAVKDLKFVRTRLEISIR